MKPGNAQRFVFTALILVLAIEFGSLTKFQQIWDLAFKTPSNK